MIFQKPSADIALDKSEIEEPKIYETPQADEVDTVVGLSVNVEGDFASEGNIIVKGSVSGSVHTSKHLLVEPGARIMANVDTGSATISGTIKGNLRVKESLELTASAIVLGDIKVKVLKVEAGALLQGKIVMKVPEKEMRLEDNKKSKKKSIGSRAEKGDQ